MYYGDRFRDALKNGGRALFLGIGAEQVPETYRDNPRLLFWDSDSPQIQKKSFDELPVRTRVVVCTRFLPHRTTEQAKELCRKTGVLFMGKLSGTGEIAKMLSEAIAPPELFPLGSTITETPSPSPPPPEVAAVDPFPVPVPGRVFRSMSECVRFYAWAEIDRPLDDGRKRQLPMLDSWMTGLTARVAAHGFDVVTPQIRQLFSTLRAQHHARNRRTTERRKSQKPAVPTPTPPEVATPAAPVPLPAQSEPLPAQLDKLVGWADELELKALTSMELAEELRRLVKEHRELREIKARYDTLMAVMQGAHLSHGSPAA